MNLADQALLPFLPPSGLPCCPVGTDFLPFPGSRLVSHVNHTHSGVGALLRRAPGVSRDTALWVHSSVLQRDCAFVIATRQEFNTCLLCPGLCSGGGPTRFALRAGPLGSLYFEGSPLILQVLLRVNSGPRSSHLLRGTATYRKNISQLCSSQWMTGNGANVHYIPSVH